MAFFRKNRPLEEMLGELCAQCIKASNAIRSGGAELGFDHPFWLSAKAVAGSDVVRYSTAPLLEAYLISLARSNFIGEHGFRLIKVGVGGVDALLPQLAAVIRRRMYDDEASATALQGELSALLPKLYAALQQASQIRPKAQTSGNQHRPGCEFLAEHLFTRSTQKLSTTDATATFIVLNGLAGMLVTQQAKEFKPVC